MNQRYVSTWWSTVLPDNWKANEEEDSVVLTSRDAIGALRISAYRRDGKKVTNDDLLHFAEDELIEGVELQNAVCGEFVGMEISYLVDENYRRKWWLWSGSLLLYVAYNCRSENRFIEEEAINQIMNSLKNTAS